MRKIKKVLAVILCAVILAGVIGSGALLNVGAAAIDRIEVDTAWNGVWDESVDVKYAYLTVNQTGFYDLSMLDRNGTGMLDLYLYDMDITDEALLNAWYNTRLYLAGFEFGQYNYEHIYLIKDHTYELQLEYYTYDEELDRYNPIGADITATFTKTDYEPTSLTLGVNADLAIGYYTNDWAQVKTDASGDYLFKINQTADVYIVIYEKSSGNNVAFSRLGYDTTIERFRLKADTEYILYVYGYEKSEKLLRLNVSKTAADVSKIDVVQKDYNILAENGYFASTNSLYSSDVKNLEYKVTYSDNTAKTFTYYDLSWEQGIYINDIIYNGKTYEYDNDSYFKTGNQPVTVCYMNDLTSASVINIISYLSFVSNLNVTSDYNDMIIEYEDYYSHTYFWRIKPHDNNVYHFYSSDWDNISVNIKIFDKNNNVVPQGEDGWVLKSGQEYALRMEYSYNADCSGDVNFDLEPARTHIHNGGNPIISYATPEKNGYIKYICAKCNHEISNNVIYSPKTFTLSASSYTYDGKEKKPSVTVKDSNGNTLKNGTDYTVTYDSGRRNVGKYKVTVNFKGNYKGTKILYFSIKPQKIGTGKSTVKLSADSYTYNGKEKKPSVTVRDNNGRILKNGTDYTVSYKNNKNVGTATATVAFKGNYSGTKNLSFTISPVKTTVSRLTAGKKSIKVNIGKKSTQVTGYQIQYSTSKAFKSAKLKKVSGYKTTSVILTKLSAKKTYYVRVRTYRTVGGKTVYSGWSAYKCIKTK